MFASLIVLFSVLLVSVLCAENIGDSLTETFGHEKSLPLTVTDAIAGGWVPVGSGECNKNLGILYSRGKSGSSGASEDHPLALYYTAAGQIAGMQTTVFGSSKDSGNAASDQLVKQGYWKPSTTANATWSIDVSFREPSLMCSGSSSDLTVGDRVIINQDTISVVIPLTAGDATARSFTAGSCIKVLYLKATQQFLFS
jgi:hypothetical protein